MRAARAWFFIGDRRFVDPARCLTQAGLLGVEKRRRQRFEKYLRLIESQRRYFSALQEVAPGRVAIVDTTIQSLL